MQKGWRLWLSEEIKNCIDSAKKTSKDDNITLARKLTLLEVKRTKLQIEVSEWERKSEE